MQRTDSSWQRWLREIRDGETSSRSESAGCAPLHAAEDGMLMFVSILTIVFFLVLLAMLGNIGRTVNQKLEVQNTADAVAQSSALWMARGLNSITATNHLFGELMSFVVLFDAFGVRGQNDSTTDSQILAIIPAFQFAQGFAQASTTKTPAYDYYIKKDPLSTGGLTVRVYHDKFGDVRYTVTEGKQALLEALTLIYLVKGGAGILEDTPFAAIGFALEFAALAVELYALAEWIVLDVIEAVASGSMTNGTGLVEIRDAILGTSPNIGLLPLTLSYTEGIRGTLAGQDNQPGLVDQSAQRIGQLNSSDAAVFWPRDLPLTSDPYADLDWNDSDFSNAQIVRATWPWVVYHRRQILHLTNWMLLSGTADRFKKYTDLCAARTCWAYYQIQPLRMYVIGDPTAQPPTTEGKDPPKGHQTWTTDADKADQLFSVIGFAHRDSLHPFAETAIFGTANTKGIVAYAQAIVYNANRQDPDNTPGGLQPLVGWDTLNWSPQNSYAFERSNGSTSWSDHTQAPGITLNWQAKLVPTGGQRLQAALADDKLPAKFKAVFGTDPLPPSLRTH